MTRLLFKRCSILLLLVFFLVGAKNPIQIKGIPQDVASNIKKRLTELSVDKALNQFKTDELQWQIGQAMLAFGYFHPEISISQENTQLIILIKPGARLTISQFTIKLVGDGKNNMALLAARAKLLDANQSGPFNSVRYEENKQYLIDAAEHQGFLHASYDKAEILVNHERTHAQINLILNTGPQFFFGQVRFDPTYICPELLQRFVPFRTGEPYSPDQILTLNQYLSSSGYFKSVNIDPQINATQTIPIDVHLQPVPRTHYSLGLGFGTDTGIRGRASMHTIPVNRNGDQFSLSGLGSFNENAIQTQYSLPGKNPLVDHYEWTANLANLNYDSGYSNSALISFGQRHNRLTFQRVLSLNSLYERFNYNEEPKVEQFSLYPKATFTWLTNANQLFIPTGYKLTLSGLASTRHWGSSEDFSQFTLDAKAAYTFSPARTRFYFHTIQARTFIDDINHFPLSLAQLLGGSDDLKGYTYNSLGPGKILSYAGLEIQKETKDNWYVIGFFDWGDVYRPSLKSPKQDIGLGLMWVSPVGPIKIGLAQPINSDFRRIEHDKLRIVISMGPDL